MVWDSISFGGNTDLHGLNGGTMNTVRCRDEILDPYIRPYEGAVTDEFTIMDGNARKRQTKFSN